MPKGSSSADFSCAETDSTNLRGSNEQEELFIFCLLQDSSSSYSPYPTHDARQLSTFDFE
jgi:hypothetical protein